VAARAWEEETLSEPESSGDDEEEDEGEEEGEITPPPPPAPLHPPKDFPSLGDLFSQQAGVSVGAHRAKQPQAGTDASSSAPPQSSLVLIYSDLQGESICTRSHENNSLAWGFVGPAILTGRQDYRVCDGGAILAGCRGRGALTQEGSPFIFPTGILPVCVWYLGSLVTTQQPGYERLLYQPDSWEIIHPVPGVVSLLLAREEGATYLKGTK
jgi:hypothetical protein